MKLERKVSRALSRRCLLLGHWSCAGSRAVLPSSGARSALWGEIRKEDRRKKFEGEKKKIWGGGRRRRKENKRKKLKEKSIKGGEISKIIEKIS